MPGVVAGLLLVFIPLTGDYITAAVLGGAKGNMVGALVASQFNTAQNWALGSAMAVILILDDPRRRSRSSRRIGLVARALIRRARRVGPRGGAGMSADRRPPPVRREARRRRTGSSAVWGVLVFVFLFLPIVMIVIYSFNDGRALVVWNEFGLKAYTDALNNPTIKSAIFTSIRAAAGAAVIATIIGSLAGIALARRPGQVDDRVPRRCCSSCS